jgi:hypothetical protein
MQPKQCYRCFARKRRCCSGRYVAGRHEHRGLWAMRSRQAGRSRTAADRQGADRAGIGRVTITPGPGTDASAQRAARRCPMTSLPRCARSAPSSREVRGGGTRRAGRPGCRTPIASRAPGLATGRHARGIATEPPTGWGVRAAASTAHRSCHPAAARSCRRGEIARYATRLQRGATALGRGEPSS